MPGPVSSPGETTVSKTDHSSALIPVKKIDDKEVKSVLRQAVVWVRVMKRDGATTFKQRNQEGNV